MADDTDLSVGVIEAAEVFGGSSDIADQSFVGHPAGCAHGCGRIIGICAGGLARIQIRHNDLVAIDGQPADEFFCLAVVSWHVMYPHHAATRTGRERNVPVCLDLVTAVALDGDGLGLDRIRAD